MGTLYGDRCTLLIISRSVLQKMKHISHKICRENRKAHFMFNKILFRKSCRLRGNGENYCTLGQATVHSMAHAHCMLDT